MADFARGDLLKKLREDRHLTQDQAAHEIGVSEKTLRAWEHGGGIQWRNAKSAGTFYDVDPHSLVSREQNGDEPAAADEDRLDEINRKLDEILERLPEVPEEPAEELDRETADTPDRKQRQSERESA